MSFCLFLHDAKINTRPEGMLTISPPWCSRFAVKHIIEGVWRSNSGCIFVMACLSWRTKLVSAFNEATDFNPLQPCHIKSPFPSKRQCFTIDHLIPLTSFKCLMISPWKEAPYTEPRRQQVWSGELCSYTFYCLMIRAVRKICLRADQNGRHCGIWSYGTS